MCFYWRNGQNVCHYKALAEQSITRNLEDDCDKWNLFDHQVVQLNILGSLVLHSLYGWSHTFLRLISKSSNYCKIAIFEKFNAHLYIRQRDVFGIEIEIPSLWQMPQDLFILLNLHLILVKGTASRTVVDRSWHLLGKVHIPTRFILPSFDIETIELSA